LAAAVAGGLVLLLREAAPWPVVAILGGVAYLPALLAVGGVDRDDLALVRRLTARNERAQPTAAEVAG
jgi:hypothetical protein